MSAMQHRQQWLKLPKCSSEKKPNGCGGSLRPGAPSPSRARRPSTHCQTLHEADPSRKLRLTLDQVPWHDRSAHKSSSLVFRFIAAFVAAAARPFPVLVILIMYSSHKTCFLDACICLSHANCVDDFNVGTSR